MKIYYGKAIYDKKEINASISVLKNKSLNIDHIKFQSLMKQSKELAKKNWKGS